MANNPDVRHAHFRNETGNMMVANTLSADGHIIINGGSASYGLDDEDAKLRMLLPSASGAEHSAYASADGALGDEVLCHQGTRVALLDTIMAWSAASDARHVFWLSGIAGTGKSTIARTVARRCADARRPTASFFFVRGGGDLASADKFVTTLALQLATTLPALKPYVLAAARGMSNVRAVGLQEQWAWLVLQPLAKVRGSLRRLYARKPVVIVVDALDECDSERDTAAILGLLAFSAALQEAQLLRVLLTSRPETRIRYRIAAFPQESLDRLILHDVEPPVIDSDIYVYLADNLRCVGTAVLADPDWPGVKSLHQQVKRAGGLFIWAATAYKFISQGEGCARGRLQDVLSGVNDMLTPEKSLDSIYFTVLKKAVGEKLREQEQSETCTALQVVLSTVVVLAAQVDRQSLSDLADISYDALNKALSGLHSIFVIPDDVEQPIRLHHASFRDYIMDPSRCSDVRFSVDGKWQHKMLAERCLRLMAERLRKDICHARDPGMRASRIDQRVIERQLSSSLRYACCYWAHHIRQADDQFQDLRSLSDFLFVHLLHWLEALSLLKKLPDTVIVLRDLKLRTVSDKFPAVPSVMLTYSLTTGELGTDLHAFVSDAERFVSSFVGTMSDFPLQIYCSALLFAPSRSLVRQLFLHDIPPWISCVPEGRSDWSAQEVTIETGRQDVSTKVWGRDEGITTLPSERDHSILAFSSDGKLVALCSPLSGVSVWDTTTGALRCAIPSSGRCFKISACFLDSHFLAYYHRGYNVYGDHWLIVYLCDVELQVVRRIYYSPSRRAKLFAEFSRDGELLAIARRGKAQVIATRTSAVLQEIAVSPEIHGLAFSQAGHLLVVVESDKVCIHDIADGRCLKLTQPGIRVELHGLFSPSDELFAFTSVDHSVRVWQVNENGRCTALVGHASKIHDVVFLPDGRLLASACFIKCIIWDVSSGTRLYALLNTGGNAWAPSISPDGKLLAWRSSKRSVRFWHSDGGNPLGSLPTIAASSSMVFSPDSQQLAYLTGDSLINIWSVNKLLARLTSGAASQTFSCITTTSDGKLLASSMPKGPVRVWVKERKIYRVLLTIDIEPAASLAFSLNSTRLAIMSLNGTVKVVDIPSGNSVLELQYEHYHRQAFSPDSQSLALLTTVRRMEVHDLRTKSVSEVPCSKNLDKIAFSPDSKSLAGTSLHTYNIFSGRGWKLRSRTPTRAWAVALSPDGRWLACALWYVNITFSDIRLFDMTDGGAFYAKYGPVHMLKRLAFSNDGRRLIVEDDKFSVETHTVPEKPAATPAPQAGPPVHFDLDREWLSYMGRRILWVPPEFREPHCHAVHDHGFVWADESGSVQHVEFNISVMGEAGGWPPAEALHNKWKRVGPLRQINYALGSFGI